MATRKTSKRSRPAARPRRAAKRTTARRAPDAIAMLRADHARVSEMFERFDDARGADRKEKVAGQICQELEVHMQLEEKIFYPAVREAIGDDDLMDEATVEHQSAKELIAQIQAMSAGDPLYDAKVTVLGEYIKHHVKEEHEEMFPQARKSGVDLAELGEQMRTRKREIASGGGAMNRLKRMMR